MILLTFTDFFSTKMWVGFLNGRNRLVCFVNNAGHLTVGLDLSIRDILSWPRIPFKYLHVPHNQGFYILRGGRGSPSLWGGGVYTSFGVHSQHSAYVATKPNHLPKNTKTLSTQNIYKHAKTNMAIHTPTKCTNILKLKFPYMHQKHLQTYKIKHFLTYSTYTIYKHTLQGQICH